MPIELSPSFEFSAEQVKNYHTSPTNNAALATTILKSDFFANAKSVLDIGCGDGKLTALFAEHLPDASILGCDASKSMIEYAVTHYSSPNLRFAKMHAEELNAPEPFDRVVSFHCLHWIKNQKQVLQQIFKVMNAGGRALLITTPESSNNDFKICRDLILTFRWLPYFVTFRPVHSFHTPEQYRQLLSAAGFSIEKIEVTPTDLIFQDRSELDLFLGAMLTPVSHLSPKHRASFLDDFYQELVKRKRVDPDGKIHIIFDEIELRVVKDA